MSKNNRSRIPAAQSPCTKPCLLALIGQLVLAAAIPDLAAAAGAGIHPIETRYAQTPPNFEVNLTYRKFTDVTLQEADQLDGWSGGIDITAPFLNRFQLRFSAPFYTTGTARLTEPGHPDSGQSIDLDSHGGIEDFPSLEFAHQLGFETESGANWGYYLGLGMVLDPLDTSAASGDIYNHRGRLAYGGIRLDRAGWSASTRLAGNLGVRYYWETDDLFPGGDNPVLADIKGALLLEPWAGKLYPALELTYLGDFSDYNATTLIPEIIIPVGTNFDVRAGIPIGLGGDGNQLGATAQVGFKF
jgi:hypothetical protein